MGLYSEHYNKISVFKENFEKIIEYFNNVRGFNQKLELALFATNYFVYKNTGYFTSSILENFFVDYAKKIKVDLSNINYNKNSILHVLTEGFATGGHTRVVERWINNAPKSQKHSVVILKPNSAKLSALAQSIEEKNGDYILFNNGLSLEEKAIKLRKLAMEYEYIVLHIHMEDPTAIIAFGTEDFKRPVFFYNHASHMPWIGKSISDLVLDIQENDEITKKRRRIDNTFFLGIPSKEISLTFGNKKNFRKNLNLPLDKKIIITSGNEAKYRPICNNSLITYLEEIIDENTYCYAIGVSPNNKEWKKANIDTNNHIIPIGSINFNKGYLDYLKSADLYLDSYPIGGGTALIDAISSGVPALALKSVCPQFDYFTETSANCQTKEEFIEKAKKILNDKEYAKEIFEEVKSSLIKYQSVEAWNEKIERLFETAPKEHKVKDLSNEKDFCENCDLSVLCNVIHNEKFQKDKIKLITDKDLQEFIKHGYLYKKRGIPFVFQILSYKKSNSRKKVIKIFNIKVYEYTKH